MKLTRRYIPAIFLAAALLPVLPAVAQNYPSQPIKLVLGVPPGGAVDGLAHLSQLTIDFENWRSTPRS